MGLTKADLNALVDDLQTAMREASIPFAAQNRYLAPTDHMHMIIRTVWAGRLHPQTEEASQLVREFQFVA